MPTSSSRSRRANAIIAVLGDRPVAYHPGLAIALTKLNSRCGAKDAIFISQLLYWDGKGALDGGWIWKTREEWQAETGLSRFEQETVRKHLVELGILEERLMGMPGKLHFRLNFRQLEALARLAYDCGPDEEQELLAQFGVATAGIRDDNGCFADGWKPTNKMAGNQQTGDQSDGNQPTSKLETNQQDGRLPTSIVAGNQPRSESTTESTSESTPQRSAAESAAEDPRLFQLYKDYAVKVTVPDVEYTEDTCPKCGFVLTLAEMPKTNCVCPGCQSPLAIFIGGKSTPICKPPPQKKSNKYSLDKAMEDCPEDLASIYCNSKAEFQAISYAAQQDKQRMLTLLYWAKRLQESTRGIPKAKITANALSAFHKQAVEKSNDDRKTDQDGRTENGPFEKPVFQINKGLLPGWDDIFASASGSPASGSEDPE
jgi:hypothetical protein